MVGWLYIAHILPLLWPPLFVSLTPGFLSGRAFPEVISKCRYLIGYILFLLLNCKLQSVHPGCHIKIVICYFVGLFLLFGSVLFCD